MSEPDDTIRLLGGFPRPDRTAAAVLVDDMFDVLERMLAAQRRFAQAILAPGDAPVMTPIPPADGSDGGRRAGSVPEADVDTDGDTLAGRPESAEEDVVTDDTGTGDDRAEDSDATVDEADDVDDPADDEDADADSDDQPEVTTGEDDAEDSGTTTSEVDEQVGTSVAAADRSGADGSGDGAPARRRRQGDGGTAPAAARRGRPGRPDADSSRTAADTARAERQRPRRSTSDVIRTDDAENARRTPRRPASDRPSARRSG